MCGITYAHPIIQDGHAKLPAVAPRLFRRSLLQRLGAAHLFFLH